MQKNVRVENSMDYSSHELLCKTCNALRSAIYDDVQSLLMKFVQHIEGLLANIDNNNNDHQQSKKGKDFQNMDTLIDNICKETNQCKNPAKLRTSVFTLPTRIGKGCSVSTVATNNSMPFGPSIDQTNITMQRSNVPGCPPTGPPNSRPVIKPNSPKPQMLRHLRTDPSLISSISEPLQDGVGEFNDCEAAIGDDPLTCDIAAWRKGVGFSKEYSSGRIATPIATSFQRREVPGCSHCTTCKQPENPAPSDFRAILNTDSSPVDDGDDSASVFAHPSTYQPPAVSYYPMAYQPANVPSPRAYSTEVVKFTIGSGMDEAASSSSTSMAYSPKSFRPLNSRANWPSNIIVANSSTSCGSYIPGAWSRQGSKAGSLTDVSTAHNNVATANQQHQGSSTIVSNNDRFQASGAVYNTSSPSSSPRVLPAASPGISTSRSNSSGASSAVTVVEIHSTTVDRRRTEIVDITPSPEKTTKIGSSPHHNPPGSPFETFITNYIDDACANAPVTKTMHIPSPGLDRGDIQRRASASHIDETDSSQRRLEARLSFREFRSRPPTPEMLAQTESDDVKIPGDVLRRAWLTASTQSRSPRIHAIFATALAKSLFSNEELASASSHTNETTSLDSAKVLAIHRTVSKQLHWDRPPRPSRAEINSKIREIDAALENLCTESKRKQARLQSVHK